MSGEVPEGWEKVEIGSMFGLSTPGHWGEDGQDDGNILVLRSANFLKAGGLNYETAALRKFDAKKLVQKRLEPGDLLLERSGGSPAQPVGRVNRFDAQGDFSASNFLQILRVRDKVDDWFAYYLLDSFYAQGGTEHLQKATTGIRNLDFATYLATTIFLPPLDEQRRIAEVLRSASVAREAAQMVVEKCGDLIQTEIDAVVADLVADPTLPVVHLGDIAMVKGGKRLPKGNEYSDIPTGFPYIRVTDWNDHEIDPTCVRWISSEAAFAIKRYTISSADLFISIAGSVGLVASVPPELDGAYLTENAAKIVLREHVEIDRDYLLLVMRSGSLSGQIRRQKGVGGGVPKLALFRIEALEIPLPSIGRQREIAASYRSLKKAGSIASQASRRAASLCESLAADLLTGRVRVPA